MERIVQISAKYDPDTDKLDLEFSQQEGFNDRGYEFKEVEVIGKELLVGLNDGRVRWVRILNASQYFPNLRFETEELAV